LPRVGVFCESRVIAILRCMTSERPDVRQRLWASAIREAVLLALLYTVPGLRRFRHWYWRGAIAAGLVGGAIGLVAPTVTPIASTIAFGASRRHGPVRTRSSAGRPGNRSGLLSAESVETRLLQYPSA
jgi:hypothetical protein